MSNQRTHGVTTTDGVTLRGTLHGDGPPLVLLQGIIGDGHTDYEALLEHLTGRFTCHVPSWRGRGLSSDHPDLSFGRLTEDVLTYVASIGDRTRLVGWSGGAGLALAGAAQSDLVDAVVAIEPLTPRLMSEQERRALGDAVVRMAERAARGQFAHAVRTFAEFLFSDEELAVAQDVGYFEAAGRYVPDLLNFFQQQMRYEGLTHEDPAVLGAVAAPVLVLVGSETKAYATAAAQHVAEHVPTVSVCEVLGAGHAAPLTHPTALAEAITAFCSPGQRPT